MAIRQSSLSPSGLWAEVMRGIFNTGQSYLARVLSQTGLAILKAGEFAALGLAILSATCIVIAAILFLRISNLRKASLLVALAVLELFAAGRAVRDTFRLAARLSRRHGGPVQAEAGRSPHPEPVQPESRHVHGVAGRLGLRPVDPPPLRRIHGLDAAGGHDADREQ